MSNVDEIKQDCAALRAMYQRWCDLSYDAEIARHELNAELMRLKKKHRLCPGQGLDYRGTDAILPDAECAEPKTY